MNNKMKKTRVSVTMSQLYVETLDRLVDEGVYLSRGEVILDSLRLFFKQLGIESFSKKEPEP